MKTISPGQLLGNPTVVGPMAPWCVALDNLDLAILLLAQPWIAGGGLTRADVDRKLAEFGSEMPLGPIYFQRTNRAVAALEKLGALQGVGVGRGRRFVLTPRGFATLVLNIQVLRSDPTVDGSEFEFKRELVAVWNLMLERLLAAMTQVRLAPEMASFFSEVLGLTVGGQRVITPKTIKESFSVLRLIERQRRLVLQMKEEAEGRLDEARSQAELLRGADFSEVEMEAVREQLPVLRDNPEILELIRNLATGSVIQLSIKSRISRFEAYLGYLKSLTRMYSKELKVIDFDVFRRSVARQGG